jgi:hypothetical protein
VQAPNKKNKQVLTEDLLQFANSLQSKISSWIPCDVKTWTLLCQIQTTSKYKTESRSRARHL